MTISCPLAVFPFDLVETYIWVLLELVFDKSKQVLLIHTGGVVDMGINLSNIVRNEFMVDDPFSQFVPFTEIPAYQL